MRPANAPVAAAVAAARKLRRRSARAYDIKQNGAAGALRRLASTVAVVSAAAAVPAAAVVVASVVATWRRRWQPRRLRWRRRWHPSPARWRWRRHGGGGVTTAAADETRGGRVCYGGADAATADFPRGPSDETPSTVTFTMKKQPAEALAYASAFYFGVHFFSPTWFFEASASPYLLLIAIFSQPRLAYSVTEGDRPTRPLWASRRRGPSCDRILPRTRRLWEVIASSLCAKMERNGSAFRLRQGPGSRFTGDERVRQRKQ